MTPDPQEELLYLLADLVEGFATSEDQQRLRALIGENAALREQYFAFMNVHAHLLWQHGVAREHAGLKESFKEATAIAERPSTLPKPPARSKRRPVPPPRAPMPARTFSRFSAKAVRRRTALALLLGSVAACILAYVFWPSSAAVARIEGVEEAIWAKANSPAGKALRPGQRLVLKSGSAQIAFNSEARVILEGPAEFVVVDANACRLSAGKLTAHVPHAAKGFQVHTPSGTVTDLGTEFGVYVKKGKKRSAVRDERSEEPKNDSRKPTASVTEVHVFRGKVDVEPGDQQTQAPTNPKSKILSRGEAVIISANKVQPLSAADPFKFALDKLSGKRRQVLLSEDFESYEVGNQVKSIGPWIVQSGTRKGQGVSVIDPVERIASSNAAGFTPIAPPPSLLGRRVAFIAAGAPNPPHTFPLLAREIDGRLLSQNCQVLLEFDVFLHGVGFQHSLAFATEIGQTQGIELWRGVDAAKQSVDAAKQSVDAAKQSVDAAKQSADAAQRVEHETLNWYRLRVLLDVVNGAPRDVRVERSRWRGPQGWARDLSFQPPLPKLDWSTPPRYVIFGYPVVTPSTPAGTVWIDNVRMEVISEK